MKLKKWLTLSLAAALLVGGVVSASAAELDYAWYAAQNPDVVAELGNSPEALQAHYEMFGKKEGRAANSRDVEAQLRKLFKAEEYAALYPDIKAFYGDDAEGMFQHYIGYGLLEARRPSEKVSQAVASALKATVEKAMADAGIAVEPGSAELVAVITGTIPEAAGGQAVQQALAQSAPEIEKAVAEAVKETTDPTPAPSNGGGSSSSVATQSYPTILVYKNVTYSGGITGLGTGTSVPMTGGAGTGSSPYTAVVAGIGTTPTNPHGPYWYAVALPCEDKTDMHYWLKITGEDGSVEWTDVTDNTTHVGSLPDGYMVYAIGDDGRGGTVDICMSTATDKSSLSDENATYYRLETRFGEDETDSERTIKVYTDCKWNDDGKLELGGEVSATAIRGVGGSYSADVSGSQIKRSAKRDGSEEYWFAIAVPAETGKDQYYVYANNNWENVTGNKKIDQTNAPAGYMVFGIGVTVSGDVADSGEVVIGVSDTSSNWDADNANVTSYFITITVEAKQSGGEVAADAGEQQIDLANIEPGEGGEIEEEPKAGEETGTETTETETTVPVNPVETEE